MESKKESVGEVATIDHQFSFHEKVYEYLLKRCGFKPLRIDLLGPPGGKKSLNALAQKVKSFSADVDYDTAAIVGKVQKLNKIADAWTTRMEKMLYRKYQGMMRRLRG